MDYIAQPKDYWIAPTAIAITLNALGEANRIQGSVASGASILCYIKNNAGQVLLDYNSGHQFRTWPLSLSPTYFNSDTSKYVYAAIPRTTSVGTMAVIVFPSEQLDVYGINSEGTQIGSADYYYIYLNGIISEVQTVEGVRQRTWTQNIDTGSKGSDEALNDPTETDWYIFSKVSQVVTFLKPLIMNPASWFQNLRLGNSNSNLTGVATATTPDDYIDSDTLVVTPSYINNKYLSKTHDDTAAGNITFEKDITVKGLANMRGDAAVGGNLGVKGWIKAMIGYFSSMQSENYTGDGMIDTGWRLTKDDGHGNSQLVVDNIVARMKFIANILEVRKLTSMGGNYVFSPAASIIEEVDYFDSNDGLLGYEYVKVPWLLRGTPTFLRRATATLGVFSTRRLVRTTMTDEDWADVAYFRCWLKADDGSTQTINTWRNGMLARCQTFDASQIEGGTQEGTYSEAGQTWTGKDVKNKLYWRAVVSNGEGIKKGTYPYDSKVLDDGKAHNYIDLSNESGMFLSGSDRPSAGDSIVCYGDYLHEDTSNIITIETIGDDAPCIKELHDVGYSNGSTIDWNNALTNKVKTRISPVAGNRFVAPEFIVTTEDGDVNLKVAIDGISAEVKELSGANMIPHTDTGEGWPTTGVVNEGVIDCDGASVFTPYVVTRKGKSYVLSIYAEDESVNMVVGYAYRINNIVVYREEVSISRDFTRVGNTNRYYYVIDDVSGLASENDVIDVYFELNSDAEDFMFPYNIQLEEGTTPTDYSVRVENIYSYVLQTADQVRIGITNGLTNTGINIQTGKVEIETDKFSVVDSQGNPMIGMNNTTREFAVAGKIHATDGLYRRMAFAYLGGKCRNADVDPFTGGLSNNVYIKATFTNDYDWSYEFIDETTALPDHEYSDWTGGGHSPGDIVKLNTTGWADYVLIKSYSSTGYELSGDHGLIIPQASHPKMRGRQIEIYSNEPLSSNRRYKLEIVGNNGASLQFAKTYTIQSNGTIQPDGSPASLWFPLATGLKMVSVYTGVNDNWFWLCLTPIYTAQA